MGFLDFFDKMSKLFEDNVLGHKKFNEDDRYIKAIYAALQNAEKDLRVYSEASYKTEIMSKDPEKEYLPKLAKGYKEEKLNNKIAVLKKLKKDINNILREF